MQLDQPIPTPRLLLRTLMATDASARYLTWMQDPQVVRYLDPREYSLDGLHQYIKENNSALDSLLLGIFLVDGAHIGNIKLGPINFRHVHSGIGVLIGQRDVWNKGYAGEAIAGLTHHAFQTLALEKLYAGFYGSNVASYQAFRRVGYVDEARLREHWSFEGRREDQVIVGITRADWMAGQLRR